MTDNSDGTYSHTFTTAGNPNVEATISASISLVTGGGLGASYWTDISQTGDFYCFQTENPNQNWSTGEVACTGQTNNVSAQWAGFICPEDSETYTFRANAFDSFDATVDSVTWTGLDSMVF